jgi:prepilin-type N-terminal cleavage/methylation domain-containing protein
MKAGNLSRGFTIIELMVTLGVVAILIAVAVPSFSSMVKGNRLSTQVNMVMADIHLARSESVKRGVRVIMCRSASPNITTPTCGGNTQDWSTGYLVFTGEDGNNTYQAGTDTLIRRGQPAQDGVDLHTTATWDNNLEINPNGTLNEVGTAIMAVCDDRDKPYGKQITIPLSGIPRMKSSSIASCDP